MTLVYAVLAIAGMALGIWARASLPDGTRDCVVPIARDHFHCLKLANRGPYRWARHPMYIGNILFITGLGGLGGGIWNALALMTLAELVHREWAWRERPGKIWP